MCVYLSQCSGCNPYESFLILAVILSNATSTRRPSLLITCMFSILCFGHRNNEEELLLFLLLLLLFLFLLLLLLLLLFFKGDFLKFSPHLFFVLRSSLLTKILFRRPEKIQFLFLFLSFSLSLSLIRRQIN